MSAITSIETDNPGVAIIVAAHNAASSNAPAGDVTAYLRAFRRIYKAMATLVDLDDDDEDENDEDED